MNKLTGKILLKISLLLVVIGIIVGGVVIGPIKYLPSAYEIEFTDEDMELFIKEENENIAKGLEYFKKDWELYIAKKHLKEQVENKTCIPFYCRYKEDFRDWHRFEKSKKIDRKGRVSSNYIGEPLNSAINRTIDKFDSTDFTGGFIMKNSALDRIGVQHYVSEGGYSIVTGGWDKFDHCLREAAFIGIAGAVLPVLFMAIVLVMKEIVWVLAIGLWRLLIRYLKWTFREIIGSKKKLENQK